MPLCRPCCQAPYRGQNTIFLKLVCFLQLLASNVGVKPQTLFVTTGQTQHAAKKTRPWCCPCSRYFYDALHEVNGTNNFGVPWYRPYIYIYRYIYISITGRNTGLSWVDEWGLCCTNNQMIVASTLHILGTRPKKETQGRAEKQRSTQRPTETTPWRGIQNI